MILAVYLGHGIFHPVAFLFFSRSFFRERSSALKLRGSIGKKKWCTSIVARISTAVRSGEIKKTRITFEYVHSC